MDYLSPISDRVLLGSGALTGRLASREGRPGPPGGLSRRRRRFTCVCAPNGFRFPWRWGEPCVVFKHWWSYFGRTTARRMVAILVTSATSVNCTWSVKSPRRWEPAGGCHLVIACTLFCNPLARARCRCSGHVEVSLARLLVSLL